MTLTKNKKNILLGIGVAGAIALLTYLYIKRATKAGAQGTAGPLPGGATAPPSQGSAYDFPISMANVDYKVSVKELQQALLDAYGPDTLPHYGADGKFGSETEAALLEYCGVSEIDNSTDFNKIMASLHAKAAGTSSDEGAGG